MPTGPHITSIVAVIRTCCDCHLVIAIAAAADVHMWPRSRTQNNGPPPDDIAAVIVIVVVVVVVIALAEATAAALSSLYLLHPIASFTC